ncbi:MAG: pyruvate carboxylase, partial [bacterium]|nr:pyruvate carboxylase [bacterium]
MFSKILVANRGEIAIRALRAANELGARTVTVFPYDDRNSVHRQKADESYEIGEEGHPVRAYLDVDEVVRVARESGAEAIYPGYGFLSENPELARAAAEAGIAFVGPSPEVLELAGNKVAAIRAAREAGIPTLASTEPSADVDSLLQAAEEIGFPIFVKAVAGGGGRGMRLVETREALPDALKAAMREADTAFGDPTVFLEQAVIKPRHIEVQILADTHGNVVHLFERDCSLQRRHQKVVEIAPAQNLDPEIRDALHRDAVAFARSIGYQNAGTVEFLLSTAGERAGEHVFIEMNPRIQVEHTVTEEITDIDLVQAQMRIAAGESLADLDISQETLTVRGAALQCRVTTEDPANDFRPDVGTVSAYRSPGGSGVRLDGGNIYTGAEISPHFDSMLVKLTCRGRDFPTAVGRARRALAEFRVRGVATNIPFLQNVLEDPDFLAGNVATDFLTLKPQLTQVNRSQDRGTKALTFLADVTVNQPNGPRREGIDPRSKLPHFPGDKRDEPMRSPFDGPSQIHQPQDGWKQKLSELGPEGFAAELRAQSALAVTDTTFRDAHQSLLATRVRTRDLLAAAPAFAYTLPELFSMEVWGGATYDVALRFLSEDPWRRLELLRQELPNIPLQMLLRGRNTVGYTPYPASVTDAFVAEAAATGVDIFRIFDALNDVSQLAPAVAAVRETGTAVAEVALCYTSNLLDPNEKLYTLDYYLELASKMVAEGAHILAIKDMAGLLRPEAARRLVTALRSEFDLPVHLHTHDTSGGQLATLLAAADAGVDAVDVAVASMAGTTSQVSMSALVGALENTERDTGISLQAAADLEPYWEAVRTMYAPFESGLPGPTGRVYHHEIPGGQLSNLRQQAIALGLGERFEAIEDMYAAANRILGNIVKVTPSSKVVGDLALALVGQNIDPDDFENNPRAYDIPASVIQFLSGELGDPPGGWPEPFRTKALDGRDVKPSDTELEEDDEKAISPSSESKVRRATLNRLLFAGPTKDYENALAAYGDVSVLHTRDYLYGFTKDHEHVISLGRGVRLLVTYQGIGDADEKGMRQVMVTLNGQPRQVQVRDRSVESVAKVAEKADPSVKGQVAAPFAGAVTVTVAEGDSVEAGGTVATIEAMKMEAAISSPVGGVVK